MSVVSMKRLLESGVHFGHQTRRWDPKMKPYIFTERNGIYIIDLQKTLELIEVAYDFVVDVISEGHSILFVGTKKQAQDSIQEEAEKCGMPYVSYRWLGGTLTNFTTIRKRVKRLNEIDGMEANGQMKVLPKKEVLQLEKEKNKLLRNLSGIRDMEKLPGAVYVIDPRREKIAVAEARKLDIPIIGVVDTNCDPEKVDYVIPSNDDAIRAISLIDKVIANAVMEGLEKRPVPDQVKREAVNEETKKKSKA